MSGGRRVAEAETLRMKRRKYHNSQEEAKRRKTCGTLER